MCTLYTVEKTNLYMYINRKNKGKKGQDQQAMKKHVKTTLKTSQRLGNMNSRAE